MSTESTRRVPVGGALVGVVVATPICWLLFGNVAGPIFWVVIIGVYWFVTDVRASIRPTPQRDRLTATIDMWLDDERPAFETVEALERDVERVMRGGMTEDYVERMPLKTRKIKTPSGHTIKVREPKPPHPGYTLGVRPKPPRPSRTLEQERADLDRLCAALIRSKHRDR